MQKLDIDRVNTLHIIKVKKTVKINLNIDDESLQR